MKKEQKIYGGLHPLKPDARDFSLGGVFGTLSLNEIPLYDFIVNPPAFWKDQRNLDFCPGFTVAEVSEDQEGVELDPLFQFAAMCKVRNNFEQWGCDLRTAFQSGVDIGSLELKDRPLSITQDLPRDDLANWKKWPEDSFEKAVTHKKGSYFRITGPFDTFDNIRAALWQHRADKDTAGVGCLWRHSWIDAPGGIIPKDGYEEGGFGHAFKIIGQKNINEELYLVGQLSNGRDIGDNGFFYFPAEMVNREFTPYGQFMFKDMPKEDALYYNANCLKVTDGQITQTLKIALNLIKRWITRLSLSK